MNPRPFKCAQLVWKIGGESESVETVSIVSSSLKGLVLGKDGLSPLAVFSKCIIYFLSAPSGHLA
jgi:hypothetical protein